MHKSLMALLLLVVLGLLPCAAKEGAPLKVVAPDLAVLSAEYGKFLDDPASPLRFEPTAVVPSVGTRNGLYGWRMKLNTTRKTVKMHADGGPVWLSQSSAHLTNEKVAPENLPAKRGLEFEQEPVNGYVFHASDVVAGVRPGKYRLDLFIEDQKVASLTYLVK